MALSLFMRVIGTLTRNFLLDVSAVIYLKLPIGLLIKGRFRVVDLAATNFEHYPTLWNGLMWSFGFKQMGLLF